MLEKIKDYNKFKADFVSKFQFTLSENVKLQDLLYELFIFGTAYIVGGFLRDISTNSQSRDLDIIIDLPYNQLIKIVHSSKVGYETNRMNGLKIRLKNLDVDIWSIDDNWAFKNNLVVRNDDNILLSIAKGCFYNYDSLVINVHTNNLITFGYNNFVKTRTLDINQKNKYYQFLNPTIEANILRAFYLKKLYQISYSENCTNYLVSRISYLNDKYSDSTERLLNFVKMYTKYDKILDKKVIHDLTDYCFNNTVDSLIRF